MPVPVQAKYYSYDSGNVQFPGYAVGRHDQWNQSGGLDIHERNLPAAKAGIPVRQTLHGQTPIPLP